MTGGMNQCDIGTVTMCHGDGTTVTGELYQWDRGIMIMSLDQCEGVCTHIMGMYFIKLNVNVIAV